MVGNAGKGRPLRDPEAADRLGIKPGTLMNARSSGKGIFASLPYLKIGRTVRYFEADVDNFLARHRVKRAG